MKQRVKTLKKIQKNRQSSLSNSERNSDFDSALMMVSIENQKMSLTSIALWFTSKERPLQFTSNTILFNRAEVATSVDNLPIKFEL